MDQTLFLLLCYVAACLKQMKFLPLAGVQLNEKPSNWSYLNIQLAR